MKRISFIRLVLCFLLAHHFAYTAPEGHISRASSTNMLSVFAVLGTCGTITLGPLSCGLAAVAAGAYAFYSWCKKPGHAPFLESDNLTHLQPTALPPSCIDRANARITMYEGLKHVYQQTYTLDDRATAFLIDHAQNPRNYQACTGTLMQHALHQECVNLVHETANLNHRTTDLSSYQAILADAIDAGRACTHGNAIDTACTAIDWARTLLRYTQAIAKGIADGSHDTIHTITHPRQFIAQLSHDAHELVCITMRMLYECGLIETLIDNDNDALMDAYIRDRSAYLSTLRDRIYAYASHLTTPQGVQTTVASATHMALTGKCLHSLGKFFNFAARNASCMITRIGDEMARDACTIATTADGVLVNAAHESAQLALRAAEQHIPRAKAMRAIAAFEPPDVHIERIAKKYPQWATDECKPLVHIFKGHDVSGKLRGLHHDYGGYLERLGHIEVLEQYSNGMYEANVLHNGQKLPKTFFPKEWSPQRVISELMQAINQVSEWTIDRGRKIAVIKVLKRDIFIVTEIDGRIVTAYPASTSKLAKYNASNRGLRE